MNKEKKKEYDKKYYLKNINKIKEYYFKNKDKRKEYKLKQNYGITLDQYNKMLSDQNGCCRICDRHESKLSKKLCVDHNHTTGKVRGLLCNSCNTNIGKFNEDTRILNKMIEYLKEHNE